MSRWTVAWVPASPKPASWFGIVAGVSGAASMVSPQLLIASGLGLPPIAHMIVRIVLGLSGLGMLLSALAIAVIIGAGYRWPSVSIAPSNQSGRAEP